MPLNPEQITELPTVANAQLTDIYYAVQDTLSVQETGLQLASMALNYTVLNYAGDPNGNLAGVRYQLCIDYVNRNAYYCSFTGDATNAIWILFSSTFNSVISPSQGGTGVSNPTQYSLPVANGMSPWLFEGPMTNGQILIGRTGNSPVVNTLTAGANIIITNSAGSITISGPSSSVFDWNVITNTATTNQMAIDNGYFSNANTLVSFVLPVNAAVGTLLSIKGMGTGGWRIHQNSGQNILIGSRSTTTGTSGYIFSTNFSDGVEFVCSVANTTWINRSGPQGNIDFA